MCSSEKNVQTRLKKCLFIYKGVGMQKYNLKPIWTASIEIYKEVERICLKHNLCMYVGAGTVLGAVRHGGFIPWDDDIDVLMPREDYERFWVIAKTELPKMYKAVTYKLDHSYPYPFGKIYETREDVISQLRKESCLTLPDGISVDVFPLDGCPKSDFANFVWRVHAAVYKAVYWSYGEAPDRSVRLFYRMKYWFGRSLKFLFSKHYDAYKLFCKIDEIIQKYDFKTSYYGGVIGNEYGERAWRMPVTIYGKGKTVKFEDTTVIVPDDCDAYLRCVYGDYMKLPPIEERHPKHLLAASSQFK